MVSEKLRTVLAERIGFHESNALYIKPLKWQRQRIVESPEARSLLSIAEDICSTRELSETIRNRISSLRSELAGTELPAYCINREFANSVPLTEFEEIFEGVELHKEIPDCMPYSNYTVYLLLLRQLKAFDYVQSMQVVIYKNWPDISRAPENILSDWPRLSEIFSVFFCLCRQHTDRDILYREKDFSKPDILRLEREFETAENVDEHLFVMFFKTCLVYEAIFTTWLTVCYSVPAEVLKLSPQYLQVFTLYNCCSIYMLEFTGFDDFFACLVKEGHLLIAHLFVTMLARVNPYMTVYGEIFADILGREFREDATAIMRRVLKINASVLGQAHSFSPLYEYNSISIMLSYLTDCINAVIIQEHNEEKLQYITSKESLTLFRATADEIHVTLNQVMRRLLSEKTLVSTALYCLMFKMKLEDVKSMAMAFFTDKKADEFKEFYKRFLGSKILDKPVMYCPDVSSAAGLLEKLWIFNFFLDVCSRSSGDLRVMHIRSNHDSHKKVVRRSAVLGLGIIGEPPEGTDRESDIRKIKLSKTVKADTVSDPPSEAHTAGSGKASLTFAVVPSD